MHLSVPIKKKKNTILLYQFPDFFSFSGSFLDCILHLIVVNLIGLPPDVDDNFTVHALVKSDLQIFSIFLIVFDLQQNLLGLVWIGLLPYVQHTESSNLHFY